MTGVLQYHQAGDFIFKNDYLCRVSTQDEQRLKCYCVGVNPVNYAQETRRRIEEIKSMLA